MRRIVGVIVQSYLMVYEVKKQTIICFDQPTIHLLYKSSVHPDQEKRENEECQWLN